MPSTSFIYKALKTVSTLSTLSTQHSIFVDVANYDTHGYLIHSVRHDVFVREQSIPPDVEIDWHDPQSQHVLAWYKGYAVGTGRLTPDGRIGRVAVIRQLRNQGIGRLIMEKLLEIARHQNHCEIILSAQQHAVQFYERLGFFQEGDVFRDLGIMHVMMRKKLGLNEVARHHLATDSLPVSSQIRENISWPHPNP